MKKPIRLSSLQYEKHYFDPNNEADLKAFKSFYSKQKWGGPCPFYLEWPYTDIPSMLLDKIVKHNINNIIKSNSSSAKNS